MFQILLKHFLHIYINFMRTRRYMNARDIVKVMKHFGNFAKLNFH